jgi:hypothetical protein
MMDALKRTLIEKAGHDFGFEYTVGEGAKSLTLGSAKHHLHVEISLDHDNFRVSFCNAKQLLLNELKRDYLVQDGSILSPTINELAHVFKRAAALAHSLPSQAEDDFELILAAELKKLPDGIINTEVERLVRQRVGQDTYRKAMLEYWGGACAVTNVPIPEILRASHAKPWSVCATDAERLDVFNGFLLTANLDALFDRFLISFTDEGSILIADVIKHSNMLSMGLNENLKLRWISDSHRQYLTYHREEFSKVNSI